MSTDMQIEIDDSLYSRQRYVLGDGAMEKMAVSNVFVSGLGGLGVEIAKNVILAGTKSITLHDVELATTFDLGSQFFLTNNDVQLKRNRAEASASKLAELNPYVDVKISSKTLEGNDFNFLKEFQCVVLTEAPLKLLLEVNKFCRSQNPPIKFIACDVRGLFCYTFCDFGDEFEVTDPTGEEPKEFFIADISKNSPGMVLTLDNQMHGLEDGDKIEFREVVGMTSLNGTTHSVKVVSPFAVTICDTSSDEFHPYEYGGIGRQVKSPKVNYFESLEKQLVEPNILLVDFCKMEAAGQIHLAMWALHVFRDQHQRLPHIRNSEDAEELCRIAAMLNEKMKAKADKVDKELITALSFTCRGLLHPLVAAVGGIVAQEVLKALTGKFTPLKQWFYLDATELIKGNTDTDDKSCLKNDRYDALRICIGDSLFSKLQQAKLFMVGCGAIGCEMLKNYAMIGIGTGSEGKVTITDNDLIEKSNLNRQFLFRPRDIQKSKSLTAAKAILGINPEIKIEPHQHKVSPETEDIIYHDEFFRSKDVIVNALDNVEARRYVDSRCVTNQVALLESGTLGPKGHIQCVVPHQTESYSSQRDPEDQDVPYCTLKSFPAVIDHTIQWARNKFESSFAHKPNLFNKFWSSYSSIPELLKILKDGGKPESVILVAKRMKSWPKDWRDCVAYARLQFEKYYNHKARQLLCSFPRDTRLNDGTLFWQSPKRPPTAIEFDIDNSLHFSFLESASRLYATVHNIKFKPEDLNKESFVQHLREVTVPDFVPSNKKIEVDETEKKPSETEDEDEDLVLKSCQFLITTLSSPSFDRNMLKMNPLEFEKDDDSNGHIDYITATSNLRATMYSIETADRFKTKKIAGKIVPAIATTTAAVSGLVAIELIKLIKNSPLDDYRNCFLNLALPVFVFSQPAPAERTIVKDGLSFTLWDRWEVHGNKKFMLKDFIKYFKDKYNFETTLVSVGVKVLYMPILPGHMKRLNHTMLKLVNPAPEAKYVDLIVSFTGGSEDEDDVPGPPVRYYFGK